MKKQRPHAEKDQKLIKMGQGTEVIDREEPETEKVYKDGQGTVGPDREEPVIEGVDREGLVTDDLARDEPESMGPYSEGPATGCVDREGTRVEKERDQKKRHFLRRTSLTYHALTRISRVEWRVMGRLGVPEAVEVIGHDVEKVEGLGEAGHVIGLVHHLRISRQRRSQYVFTSKRLKIHRYLNK